MRLQGLLFLLPSLAWAQIASDDWVNGLKAFRERGRSRSEQVVHLRTIAPPELQLLKQQGFRVHIDPKFYYGKFRGTFQTGKGGRPGSSSPARPHSSELGIDTVQIGDLGVDFHIGNHVIKTGYQRIRMSGRATIENELISQNAKYPVGTQVRADIGMDWYRLGYGYQFKLPLSKKQMIVFTPDAQLVVLDMDYQLRGNNGAKTDRTYAKAGLRMGGRAEWYTGTPISVAADIHLPLPIPPRNHTGVFNAELVVNYQLWGTHPHTGGKIKIGIAYMRINYQDDQDLPNHIRADFGPLLVVGGEFDF